MSGTFFSSTDTSSSGRSMSGRKIDLLITTKQEVELSCCEFKAYSSSSLIYHQKSKNLRLNQGVMESLRRMHMNSTVIGLIWKGKYGYVFVLKADVVNHNFVNTLKLIVTWKSFLVDQEKKVAKKHDAPSSRQL
ncbi:hypothetical protein EDC96DRAFT_550003 [Choanephora cucurbitarum]|nr:hypothetical protein EDC96DRAFT_550003 [Choanephora cucurbitarum]